MSQTLIIGFILVALAATGVATFVFWRSATRRKGAKGEREIARLLKASRCGKHYVVNDLLFSCGKDLSCQIDHILINRNGIFVVETKNYAGEIYGSDSAREWTQVLAHGTVKNRLYNPVMQNETHIRRLKGVLKETEIFRNVVVFLQGADLKGVSSPSVCSAANLNQILTENIGFTLSKAEMKRYYRALVCLKKNSHVTKRRHVKNIKRAQKKHRKD